MQIVEHILIALAIMAGIAWPAIFIVVFIDKLRGTSMGSFFSGGRYHLPKNFRSLPWLKRLILLPLFIPIFALILFLLLPPLCVVELLERLRAKLSGQNTKKASEKVV